MPLGFTLATGDQRWSSVDWPRPLAVHGRVGSVAEDAAIILVREQVASGHSIVVLAAIGTPIRLIQDDLGLRRAAGTRARAVTASVAERLEDSQLVLFHGSPQKLQANLSALPDWSKRIVIAIQAHASIDRSLWAMLEHHPQLIVEGDFTRVTFNPQMVQWATTLVYGEGPDWMYGQDRTTWPGYVGQLRKHGQPAQPIILSDQPEF